MNELLIKGYVHLKQTEGGVIIFEAEGPNLVMQLGKELMADLIIQTPGATKVTHMALGDGGSTLDAGDTVLINEIPGTRELAPATLVANEIIHVADFSNLLGGGGSYQVEEMGLFNDAVAGIMLARWLVSFEFSVTSTVEVSWQLAIG